MNRTQDEHLSTASFIAGGESPEQRRKEDRREPEERGGETRAAGGGGAAMEPAPGPLLPADFSNDLRTRWDQIQTGFVDEPRAAVKQADELVALAMKRLAENFSEERSKLEHQWDRGDQVSTEDLRIALRKYRSFFHRLLSV
ncbi:MAG: hypothetical protein LAQ30_21915 [Acidobacteriia bacterium]|nr:hypothetical protein [Terriglobia bacterium]